MCACVIVVVVVIEYSSDDLVGLVINEISFPLILCAPDRSDLGLGQYLGSTLHRITR